MAKANRVYKQKAPVAKNDRVEADIIDLTYQGMGVAKVDGFPLFVANALPGERVLLSVTKVLKNYGFARIQEIVKASPDRVELQDKLALTTGIAPMANLSYPAQLAWKQRQVRELFKKAQLRVAVAPTLGMADPTHYRNKAQVPAQMVNGRLETGFYRRGSHRLIPTDSFYIQDDNVDEAIRVSRDLLQELGVTAYDEETGKGLVRHVMARYGKATGQLMVVIITAKERFLEKEAFIAGLRKRLPKLVSLVQNVNAKKTNVIMGQENHLLWGQAEIEDQLLGKAYLIGPNSFYQVNPETTAKLYSLARDMADLKPTDTVIDAYCGIGTIALTIADKVKKVLGVEVVEPAIEDARQNAKLNGIWNADFVVADAPEQMHQWASEGKTADVVFVDPPRKGLTKDFIEAVGVMKPERLIYVSCNPATLARDVKDLLEEGYEVDGRVQPVDQFPQTMHVEAVVKLVRVKK